MTVIEQFHLRGTANDHDQSSHASGATIAVQGANHPDAPDLNAYVSRDSGGAATGVLTVRKATNAVELVYVRPDFRRAGVASALLAAAKKDNPGLNHSDTRTPAGEAWAKKQGAPASTETSDARQSEWDGEDALRFFGGRSDRQGVEVFHLRGTENDHDQSSHASGSGVPRAPRQTSPPGGHTPTIRDRKGKAYILQDNEANFIDHAVRVILGYPTP